MADRLPFAVMLSGGHPNSLVRMVEVVEILLADPARLDTVLTGVDVKNILRELNALQH